MTTDAGTTLRRLWELLDAQAWDDLHEVLDADVVVTYLHSALTMDRDAFVRFNREYPGRWHCDVAEAVASGERVVARVRIHDDSQTFWVASFATVRDGLVAELTEVWTDAVVVAQA